MQHLFGNLRLSISEILYVKKETIEILNSWIN